MIKFKMNEFAFVPKKLKAKWTLELLEELKVYYGQDVLNKIYMEELEKNPFFTEEEFLIE